MEQHSRSSWGSNLGFLMAAIGSAVGLGNIWGFPYKMGKSGGFTFLIVYILLGIFVGFVIMSSELAIGRKTKLGPVGAYNKISSKFKWIGFLAVFSPFIIMSFYTVLGGYCLQYLSLNLAELSFGLRDAFGVSFDGSTTFGAMLTNPIGCAIYTLLFLGICYLINKGNLSDGIEKFNKIGMPALFVMLVIVIIRSVTLPGASEGLKFMFVPGYAVKAGFIEEAPSLLSVISIAGGQMFFSLSLAMGIMVTYGSYLSSYESLKKNSLIIVFSDTTVALMAGIAVIPAAVANGIANGVAYSDIQLAGPKLLFVTLQDVFSEMGAIGPFFGIVFYTLVLIAAISSAISLIEVVVAYFVDRGNLKGKPVKREKAVFWVCIAIAIEALLVAIDGLGASGIFTFWGTAGWNDCLLDFMDCWSEGVAMPLGAMLMALMVGYELNTDDVLAEIHKGGKQTKAFDTFYKLCIRFITPVAMAIIFAGIIAGFFTNLELGGLDAEMVGYIIAGAVLVIFFFVARTGKNQNRLQ